MTAVRRTSSRFRKVLSGVFEYAKEWPKARSTHLTRLPFPDAAVTPQWLRDEWNQRGDGHLVEHEALLHPYTNEPLTEETLRELLAECSEDGFSYEESATDIANVTRGIVVDFDDADASRCPSQDRQLPAATCPYPKFACCPETGELFQITISGSGCRIRSCCRKAVADAELLLPSSSITSTSLVPRHTAE